MHYSIRITLLKQEKFFGPGVVSILQGIDKLGSLNSACKGMNMSYTKGWRILKNTEKQLGFKLTERHIGGTEGGSSRLTDKGREFLNDYLSFVNEVDAAAAVSYDRYLSKYDTI